MAPIVISVRWHARRALRALGWPGGVGLLAIVTAAAYWQFMLPAARADNVMLKRQLAAARPIKVAEAPSGPTKPSLDDFYRFFPSIETVPDWIDKLDELAGQHKLTLAKAQYRLAPEPSLHLRRYRIDLPLTGRYLDIRQFLQAVLLAMPHAVLDDVSFERQDATQANVTAHVQLSLLLGAH